MAKPTKSPSQPALSFSAGAPKGGLATPAGGANPRLSEEQVEDLLAARPEWSETGGSIQRTFQFKNFVESMSFVNRVAEAAERANHHPDILIRYNKVTMTLSTHDAGGITKKDFDLAAKMDAMLSGEA